MKASFRTSNGSLTFEMEGASPKELFKKLALVQEIFDSDHECGSCHSANIKFRSRQVDDFEFYELGCKDCHARMQFGQNKKGGGLFPKRKDSDGNYLPNNGWEKYNAASEGNGNGNGNGASRTTAMETAKRLAAAVITDDDVPF